MLEDSLREVGFLRFLGLTIGVLFLPSVKVINLALKALGIGDLNLLGMPCFILKFHELQEFILIIILVLFYFLIFSKIFNDF